jgi:hypothetical protein
MTRYLLDTGSAGDYINRRRRVYERAREAVTGGRRVGIGLFVDERHFSAGRDRR